MKQRLAIGLSGVLEVSPAVLVAAHRGGAGTLDFFALFDGDVIDANLLFLQRGRGL